MRKSVLTILLGVAVLWSAGPASAIVYGWNVGDAERAAGKQLFADHCGTCHGRAGVAKGFAPSLVGVIGRRAGSAPGFPYSEQLKKSGIVWSEDIMLKWIANAPGTVPGTPMPHVSITDPVERLYIFEYLKTVSRGKE